MKRNRFWAGGAAVFLACTMTAGASPAAVEDFSLYDESSPWISTAEPWSYPAGNTWCIVTDANGNKMLRSNAIATEVLGSGGQYYYQLDRQPPLTRLVFDLQIPESGVVPTGGNAVLIISFSRDRDIGATPESAFGVWFAVPSSSQGTAATGAVKAMLSGKTGSPEGSKAEVEISSLFDASVPFRLEIEVDAAGGTVKARINEDSWSEPVPLGYPWSDVKYFRLYQRLLQVEVKKIEFSE